ncbi:hypothetical protein J7E62_29830 [Variovorax paradoxus]|nr:hypothetical protein [Variovorax paradoxus]
MEVEGANASAGSSGVSWGAVFAGALGAAALSLILVLLGTGFGLSSISPWTPRGASATRIGVATILWIAFTQIAASGIGGYLAGRLRTKWAGVRTDEVYFRDTAHGLLAWALATLVTAAALTSTIGAVLGTGAQAGASMMGGAATAGTTVAAAGAGAAATEFSSGADTSGPLAYFVDSMFRKAPATSSAPGASPAPADSASPSGMQTQEVSRIFLNSIRAATLPAEDARYVGQVVAQRTGVPQDEAEKRVKETFARAQGALNEARDKAKAAADAARKASAYASLWLFISLLIGAFVASFAATYGGRQRDL